MAGVLDQRRELVEIDQLTRELATLAEAATRAGTAWGAAEHAAQQKYKRRVEELSTILERTLKMMSSDVTSAWFDPATLTPRVNGKTLRQLRKCGGLVTLAIYATHLPLFTAARTLPGARMPAFLWADSPFDGLGAGPSGRRDLQAAIQATADAIADTDGDAQIILTTPHPLNTPIPGARSTKLTHRHRFVPHASLRQSPR
ncbi:hypothetical protein ACIRL2_41500 [Embleya sp. NPDC127516]|uniref:hypothetical protein n=1 Tax=Embleya sp. NPDC127516 TaxID=3363990 RepID=UPI0037FEDB67